MKKNYYQYLLLFLSPLGFAQIPQFPTTQNPNPSNFQTYSDQTFTSTHRNNTVPVIPKIYNNERTPEAYQNDIKRAQEDIKRFEKEQIENEKAEFERRVKSLEDSGYNLPSLSGKAGTDAYYDAFDKLSSLGTENYSTTEANFIVENAFYDGKQNFQQFKAGIPKDGKTDSSKNES